MGRGGWDDSSQVLVDWEPNYLWLAKNCRQVQSGVEWSGVGDSVLQMGREELGLGLDWGPCS